MMPCAICGMRNVWGYVKMPGTDKAVCVPCVQTLAELYKQYISDVIHKAPKSQPSIHTHKKIQDPDSPSGHMI